MTLYPLKFTHQEAVELHARIMAAKSDSEIRDIILRAAEEKSKLRGRLGVECPWCHEMMAKDEIGTVKIEGKDKQTCCIYCAEQLRDRFI